MTDAERTEAPGEPEPDKTDGLAYPLDTWARIAAMVLGVCVTSFGCYATLRSDNQAGTALALVAGALLLLIGLQGTPLRRFGSGDHSFELATIRRRLAEVADRAADVESPELATAVAEIVTRVDPEVPIRRRPPQLYESSVIQALVRAGATTDPGHRPGPGDLGVDARAVLPTGTVNVEVKYRSSGTFRLPDLVASVAKFKASGLSGGFLIVTNVPLSGEARIFNGKSAGQPDGFEVITWNGEQDDDLLKRALPRNAR